MRDIKKYGPTRYAIGASRMDEYDDGEYIKVSDLDRDALSAAIGNIRAAIPKGKE